MESWLTGGSFTIRFGGTSPILELPSPGPNPLRTAPPACCGGGFECSEAWTASLLLALPPFGTTPTVAYGKLCPISHSLHPPASRNLSKTARVPPLHTEDDHSNSNRTNIELWIFTQSGFWFPTSKIRKGLIQETKKSKIEGIEGRV